MLCTIQGEALLISRAKEERFYDSIGTVHGGTLRDGRIADRHL